MWTSARRLSLAVLVITLWAARADAGICVDIDLHTARNLSSDVAAALEREATAIWAPYGVDLHWRLPGCAIEDASFDILIEGRLSRTVANRPVLGSTEVQLTPIECVPIVIDYNAVDDTLSSLTMEAIAGVLGRDRLYPEDMGRALGRVAAHELGHVLLGLPNHQRQGLMRASFRAIELIGALRQQVPIVGNGDRTPRVSIRMDRRQSRSRNVHRD